MNNMSQSPGRAPFSGSPTKRREMDIMKLMMSNYEVKRSDSQAVFYVKFSGPKETVYEGGVWKVRVSLPENYPYKSPSIGFVNKIYHPNVDLSSGSVCLDVINQSWSPLFDLVNIFKVFLPQLLAYGNPADPLNSEAASMMMKQPKAYEDLVKTYVQQYAKEGDVSMGEEDEAETDEDDVMSDASSGDDMDIEDFEL
mmetsp:Transcript_12083/g.17977  ORF Transcript_12083/g.17977 Transcript_12083/m.17977 type:complete len:197 (-) Transcript_12083:3893-4483(-)